MDIQGFNFTLDVAKQWTRSAACAESDAPYMFPSDQDRDGIRAAKNLCAGCPVRAMCLDEALSRREGYGIWGGLTAAERAALQRRTGRKRAIVKGRPVDDVDTGSLT